LSNSDSDSDRLAKERERLRSYLNPQIRGKKTDVIIDSLASGPCHLITNVEAVNDSLYIVKAQGRFLDARLADRQITRPDNVGLSDETFREIGIEISNRKQVRDLMLNILRIMYGEEFTRATTDSAELETYTLTDGDTLIIQFDDEEEIEVNFKTSQFASISAATAQEVADSITREIRRLGRRGSALALDDGAGGFVRLISDTDGPSSTVRVLGGRAQNVLKFPEARSVAGDITTQWTLTQIAGGSIRATWTGGADPTLGKVKINDYVNIFGSAFNSSNQGTFTITAVQGGLINESYIEFENPNGVAEVVIQGTTDAILFFNPKRQTLNNKTNFAAVYQTESRTIEIFAPATTRVVRRERIGSAHIHESGASGDGNEGPYVFDTSKPFTIGGEEAATTSLIDSSTSRIIEVDDATPIPDKEGHIILGFGTSKEEGPIPYIASPSSTTIIVDPSYKFQNVHSAGTDVALVSQNFALNPDKDGTDYGFYLTDIVSGRLYAEEILKLVAATGINVVFFILYPEDKGLGKWGDENNSEKFYIWGQDPTDSLF